MFTLDDLQGRLKNPRELLRARQLRDQGAVSVTVCTVNRITAYVRGSEAEPYEVELELDLTGSCTCRAFYASGPRKFCKHMAALGVSWLESGGDPVNANAIANSMDSELAARVLGLSPQECRDLLLESAHMVDAVRQRIIAGRWQQA